jgi:hypothetical protein
MELDQLRTFLAALEHRSCFGPAARWQFSWIRLARSPR